MSRLIQIHYQIGHSSLFHSKKETMKELLVITFYPTPIYREPMIDSAFIITCSPDSIVCINVNYLKNKGILKQKEDFKIIGTTKLALTSYMKIF